MIVPMKKVSLVLPASRKEETLKKLRKLGVLHIAITEGERSPGSPETSVATINDLRAKIALLENAMGTVADHAKTADAVTAGSPDEAVAVAEKILALSEETGFCRAEAIILTAELERLKVWGDIDPAEFAGLAEKGIRMSLYEMPPDICGQIGDSVKTLILGRTKTAVNLLVVESGTEEEGVALDSLRTYRTEFPKTSTAAMREQLAGLEHRMTDIGDELVSLAGYTKSMKDAVAAFEKEIEFEVYANGMTDENLSDTPGTSFTVAYFTGYIEEENLDKLKTAAREQSWGLLVEDPTEEDDVPTKLKNNKFVSLIYPLTDFLGTVPGYFEYDISAWFLGFILIFFGIIFGDGGYGLFLCAVAAVPIIKALLAKKEVPPTFLLFGLFGLSTVLWGTLTCTWFGLSPEYLPEWLKSLSVPVISNVYADKIWYPFWTNGEAGLTTSQNLQIFCFTLALVQLTVAHLKGVVRNRKSVKLLGDIGSILQLIGIYYVVLTLVVNGAVFGLDLVIAGIPVGTVAVALIGVGFVMSFVFANYEGHLGQSILASVKDIVSVLLGVVNVFSDIVSYIRLWAVGLAGAAISATVNELASPFLGNFLFMIVALVLLVFGHGLNMILNVLSVIVHGIRLNTLEFSSHLGMSWSGHKFRPFEE